MPTRHIANDNINFSITILLRMHYTLILLVVSYVVFSRFTI